MKYRLNRWISHKVIIEQQSYDLNLLFDFYKYKLETNTNGNTITRLYIFANEFSSGGPHDTKDPEQAFPHWRWTFISLSNTSTASRPLLGPKLNETVPLKLVYFLHTILFGLQWVGVNFHASLGPNSAQI